MSSIVRQLILIMALALALLEPASPAMAAQKVTVGQAAPDFVFTLVDGRKVSLKELKGQVIVINFWATWCIPCRKELPLLDAFYRKQKDKGLTVFAITTEGSVPLRQLKDVFAAMAIPAVKSVRGPYWHKGAVPTNIVIGRDGIVRYFDAGSFGLEHLAQIIMPVINEPAPVSSETL